MLIHKFQNKDPYIVLEEAPLIVLDSKSTIYMANNGKYNNHTRQIERMMYFLRNGEKCKMHKIDQCEGGLKLAYIGNRNYDEHDLTQKIKYIMVILGI